MSAYKEYRFSDLIEEVEERNISLEYGLDDIVGVTIEKGLIPTIANLTQTALDKFYIVKPDTFVYNPRTHGVRLGMGYNDTNKTFLTSWNNVAFRVKEDAKKIVLSKYLWIYFNRPEWDRQTNFMAWGSSTIVFAWNDFLSIKIQLPDLKEQEKIVNTYNVITKRIQLKQKINENLEKTALSIINEKIGQTVFSNSTEKEIEEKKNSLPQGWNLITISEYCSRMESGSTPSRSENEYWINGNIPWLKSGEVHNNITFETEEYITEKGLKETSTKLLPVDTVLMAMYGVTAGEVGYLSIPATTNQAICGMICKNKIEAAYLFFALIQNQKMISQMSNGGAQNNLSKAFIESMFIVVPKEEDLLKLKIDIVLKHFIACSKELVKLQELKQLVISRISGM